MTEMELAYRAAALAVRQRLAEQHPQDLAVLNTIGRKTVGVYRGSYDSVEKILRQLKVPVTMNPKPARLQARILFVNCSNQYDEKLLGSLAEQVETGVWLVSSDWALEPVIAKYFPNTLRKAQGASGDEVVSVEPDHASLWSEVVVLGADPQWWLESASHPILVLDRERVKVEAASHELLKRFNAPVVGASFDWGKGHVFHVMSHFWCKRSRAPTPRHNGPGTDFLKAGMNLSDDGIADVFRQAKLQPEQLNFAQMQSAATSTELVAQLCIRAVKAG